MSESLKMSPYSREYSSLEDWSLLTVAAFLLLSLGLMLGMFIEKSLKKLSFRKPESSTASHGSAFDLEGNSGHLLPPVDKKLVPKHIAVIMDGNRRFGKLTHADPLQGHWAGGQTLIDFVQWCMLDGVEMATVYAFSTENWNRDPLEVTTLMTIFAKYAESFLTEALSNGVKVQIFSTGEHFSLAIIFILFYFLFLQILRNFLRKFACQSRIYKLKQHTVVSSLSIFVSVTADEEIWSSPVSELLWKSVKTK
jgi:hypothetical protein